MEYDIKTDKDTTSTTGKIDPRDILVDDDQEDEAWSIAGAIAWAKEEQEEEKL